MHIPIITSFTNFINYYKEVSTSSAEKESNKSVKDKGNISGNGCVIVFGLKKKVVTLLNYHCPLEHCSILKILCQWAKGGVEF